MSEAWVANASPLIFLSYVQGITWLTRLSSDPVWVPAAVIGEIEAGAGGAERVNALRGDGRISIVSDLGLPAAVAAWDLGAGESQVLAHCHARGGARAVLDDRAARDCARSLGIPVIGTLGIVLAAKRKGWIAAARPLIEHLMRHHNLYLAQDLVTAALKEIGE